MTFPKNEGIVELVCGRVFGLEVLRWTGESGWCSNGCLGECDGY